MSEFLKIGEVARATGVPAKTIRYYEDVGVLPAPERAANGYRLYTEDTLRSLSFIRASRDLGFPLEDVRTLLGLWQDRSRPSREVQALARKHIDDVDARIAELTRLRDELEHLVHQCHGDDRPDCPILDALAPEGNPKETR